MSRARPSSLLLALGTRCAGCRELTSTVTHGALVPVNNSLLHCRVARRPRERRARDARARIDGHEMASVAPHRGSGFRAGASRTTCAGRLESRQMSAMFIMAIMRSSRGAARIERATGTTGRPPKPVPPHELILQR